MSKTACERCGAMILPETAEQTGGQCMPCKKGLRQMWERQKANQPPRPSWDKALNDLGEVDIDDFDYDEPFIPAVAAAEVLELFVGDDVDVDDAEAASVEDIIEALTDSGRGLAVDWRAALDEVLATIKKQLSMLDVTLSFTVTEDGCSASVQCDGRSLDVKYRPSDNDDFDRVVSRLNALTDSRIEYRRLRSSVGSDTWEYALATPSDWSRLESRYPRLSHALFLVL